MKLTNLFVSRIGAVVYSAGSDLERDRARGRDRDRDRDVDESYDLRRFVCEVGLDRWCSGAES
jgi:hypothetical protein